MASPADRRQPRIFVTCDKIAAHIAMCYNVPTFASFDRSESNTLAGKIVKGIKKISRLMGDSSSKFKTFCLFTPPTSIEQKIQHQEKLYNIQFVAYRKSLLYMLDFTTNEENPATPLRDAE